MREIQIEERTYYSDEITQVCIAQKIWVPDHSIVLFKRDKPNVLWELSLEERRHFDDVVAITQKALAILHKPLTVVTFYGNKSRSRIHKHVFPIFKESDITNADQLVVGFFATAKTRLATKKDLSNISELKELMTKLSAEIMTN